MSKIYNCFINSIKIKILILLSLLFVVSTCHKADKYENNGSPCFTETFYDENTLYHFDCYAGLYSTEISISNVSYFCDAELILSDSISEGNIQINFKSDVFDIKLTAMTDFYSIKGGSGTFNLNNEIYQLTIASGNKTDDKLFIKAKALNSLNKEFLIVIKAYKIN